MLKKPWFFTVFSGKVRRSSASDWLWIDCGLASDWLWIDCGLAVHWALVKWPILENDAKHHGFASFFAGSSNPGRNFFFFAPVSIFRFRFFFGFRPVWHAWRGRSPWADSIASRIPPGHPAFVAWSLVAYSLIFEEKEQILQTLLVGAWAFIRFCRTIMTCWTNMKFTKSGNWFYRMW